MMCWQCLWGCGVCISDANIQIWSLWGENTCRHTRVNNCGAMPIRSKYIFLNWTMHSGNWTIKIVEFAASEAENFFQTKHEHVLMVWHENCDDEFDVGNDLILNMMRRMMMIWRRTQWWCWWLMKGCKGARVHILGINRLHLIFKQTNFIIHSLVPWHATRFLLGNGPKYCNFSIFPM